MGLTKLYALGWWHIIRLRSLKFRIGCLPWNYNNLNVMGFDNFEWKSLPLNLIQCNQKCDIIKTLWLSFRWLTYFMVIIFGDVVQLKQDIWRHNSFKFKIVCLLLRSLLWQALWSSEPTSDMYRALVSARLENMACNWQCPSLRSLQH